MEEVKSTDQEMATLREAHKKRAAEITTKCAFTELPLSDRAKEACKIIEMVFEEATQEIALMLPGEFRTALCLEHLEAACLWAKKAIHAHDQYLIKLEKANGQSDNQN